MKIEKWQPLPPEFQFNYKQQELQEIWQQVHAGDQEIHPLDYEGDEASLQAQADAWLHYHNGDFQKAAQMAVELGDEGSVILAKSVAAYCDYLCEDEDEALALLQDCMEVCEKAAEVQTDYANAQFVCALIIGRYSQRISITKALSQGLGGKIKGYLEKTLELEENHAEAHTAMGLYHAEIIDKVGAMLGGLTYGAKKPIAVKHFETSMQLTPNTAITAIEYANGLTLLKGKSSQISELLEHASQCQALDALQNCDVNYANEQLE